MEPRVLIAGGSGYLGSVVRDHLAAAGYRCQILTRSPRAEDEIAWDGKTLDRWTQSLEGAAAILNFSGASVAKKWTESYKETLVASRVEPSMAIGQALSLSDGPPPVWINGCAAGIYGDTSEVAATEATPPGKTFLAEVCTQWEASIMEAETPRTRKVILRTGSVLGTRGGMLPILTRLAKVFLGGAAGPGRQWVSWVHEKDFVRIVQWAIENPVEGPFNAVGPSPVRNAELMTEIRRQLHRPWIPNAPSWVIRMIGKFGGPDPSLPLMSNRVIPSRLLEHGFIFEHTDLRSSLAALLQRKT